MGVEWILLLHQQSPVETRTDSGTGQQDPRAPGTKSSRIGGAARQSASIRVEGLDSSQFL
jgi:hypothetical protein